MSSIPIASSFLAGSLLSILLPITLLIGLVIWYTRAVKRVPQGPPPADIAPIKTDAEDADAAAGQPG